MIKRILLFVLLNFLVIATVSLVCSIFNVQPYLTAYGLDYQALAIFCLIWGMVGSLISLGLSRVMAKWLLGVKIIQEDTNHPEFKELLTIVSSFAAEAGLPMPQVGVYSSPETNAFATGPSKNRSLIAVSSGLLQKMNRKEIAGVIGHEMAHIANGDMVTMALLQGVVNAFVLFLSRLLASLLSGMGRNRDEGKGSYGSFVLFTYLFEALFMTLGFILIAAYSRYREFKADHGGAQIAGKDSMIAALRSLMSLHQIQDPNAAPAMAAFKITRSSKKGVLAFFSTHPPLEERIERLEQL